jgi:hypothetical protein
MCIIYITPYHIKYNNVSVEIEMQKINLKYYNKIIIIIDHGKVLL